ncbi:MAG: rhodanese-like domain-containing protein [Elusimicrobia bacterium]|nr:rhodanese-like domain-containing protein [Elusimicrobiota bacterium]
MPVLFTTQSAITAVDFFKAKLQFEQTPHGLKKLLDEKHPTLLVVDVRDAQAYEKEHIPGAVNIPLGELSGRLREIGKDKTVVTYCWNITCALATRAALELAHRGYKVQELMGGIDRWKIAGMPVDGDALHKL